MFLRNCLCLALLASLAGCATTASQCNASDSDTSLIGKLNCDYGGGYAVGVRNSEQSLLSAQEQNRQFNEVYAQLSALQASTRQDLQSQQRQQASLEKSLNGLLSTLKARHGNKSDVQKQIAALEQQLKAKGIPYECGVARFRETSRGHIMGLQSGMMKLLFSLDDRKLMGCHIIGEGATELVHIGQAVLNLGGTVDYFVENTFNYPTLAEAYKIAALDAFNRMPGRAPTL